MQPNLSMHPYFSLLNIKFKKLYTNVLIFIFNTKHNGNYNAITTYSTSKQTNEIEHIKKIESNVN